MLHETRYLEKVDAENLDQRLKRIERENGYTLSVIRQDDLRRYHVKRNGKDIADLETLPCNGNRLELRSARLAEEKTLDFFDVLNAELRSAYQINAAIGQGAELATYRVYRDFEDVRYDEPEEEAKRQEIVAKLSRGLPPIAQSEPPPTQTQSEASRAVNEPGDSNAILHRIIEMHSDLGERLDDIKRVEVIIYERIGSEAKSVVNSILSELREQAISQGEMQRMLDAIRRALKYALQKGLPVDDPAIRQSLEEIYKAVNSNASIKQQLELSLPVIPYLLNYKVGLDMGADLGAVWKELAERVQKNKNN